MTPLQTALAEGRLTYGAWTRTDAAGRQLLCLFAAMLDIIEAEIVAGEGA